MGLVRQVRVGNIYKHKNNTDVAIRILSLFYIPEKRVYNVKISWINIGPHQWFDMNLHQRINIKADDIPDWQEIIESPKHRRG